MMMMPANRYPDNHRKRRASPRIRTCPSFSGSRVHSTLYFDLPRGLNPSLLPGYFVEQALCGPSKEYRHSNRRGIRRHGGGPLSRNLACGTSSGRWDCRSKRSTAIVARPEIDPRFRSILGELRYRCPCVDVLAGPPLRVNRHGFDFRRQKTDTQNQRPHFRGRLQSRPGHELPCAPTIVEHLQVSQTVVPPLRNE